MPALRIAAVLLAVLGLAACDSASGPDAGATSGVWSGTAEFKVDTVFADQNFRVITDYETRYEFEVEQDADGLVIGFLNQYNTGTFMLREPRGDGADGPAVREFTRTWDDELVQTWPVYGTFVRPTLELDLPEAEQAGVFPKDMWTFTVVGDRARLDATRIDHGYSFRAFENYDAEYTIVLSPGQDQEFSMRRQ